MQRRAFLIAAGLIGGGYAAVQVLPQLWSSRFQFEPIPHLPGFRRIGGGDISRARSPLIGLETAPGRASAGSEEAVDVCDALFGARGTFGGVRLAYFSDFNCPICRVMSEELIDLEASMDGALRLTWRELPILGDRSMRAARAAIAAGRQDAYLPAHRRLMRSRFEVTPAYLRSLADGLEIEWDRFYSDYESASAMAEIETSLSVARLFGFYGTPGIVVERTAALGYLNADTIRDLTVLEQAAAGMAPCA